MVLSCVSLLKKLGINKNKTRDTKKITNKYLKKKKKSEKT